MSEKPTYEELEQRLRELEAVETDRKRAIAALQESEGRLRSLINALPDLVWLKDMEGVYLACNARFETFFGEKEKDIVGKNDYDFMAEDLADFFRSYDQAALEKGGPNVNEEEITFAQDGHREIIETIKTPMYSTDGRLLGVLGIGRDITERKQTEAALHENEEKYRVLFNAFPLGITISDASGNIVESNVKSTELLGIPVHEQQLRTIDGPEWRIVRPDGSDMPPDEWASVRALKEKRMVKNTEMGIMKSDGTTIWLNVVAAPLPLEKYGIVITYSDITDRKLAETEQAATQQELIKRNRFIETILAHLPIGLGVNYINSGEVTFINKKFEEIYGWPQADFPNIACFFDYVFPDPERRDILRERILSDIASGDPARMEWEDLEISTKKGERRVVYAKNIPIPDQNLMISTVQDVTAQRKLEAQVQQAQKMESIGRLAGGVAHDFNNMLNLIIGHADMVLEDLDGASPFYDNLVEIKKAGERSADLTRQLLAFARKQTVSPKVLDLNRTITGMTRMLQRLIGEDIDLRWVPGENVWPVKMDPSQIDQILANLCINARDAITDIGSITIETAIAEFDETYCDDHPGFIPGEYVLLAVSDNGCGMDAETLACIFEPFFTTKESGKGTGLGLATVYGVVRQNHGFVNVYSEPGLGTIFRIYLPRYRTRADLLPEERKEQFTETGHETILLVEDEEAILRMTTLMLKKMGYQVLTARTPGEAIHLAQAYAGEIQLIVTDVVMPEMNGRDLATHLMTMYPGLRHLFMSGYTADVIAHHGVLDPGVNFIQKPFSRRQLGEKVREALDKDI
ncbi:MAG: PAS domain S-box protein [Thermodesulfobacteriota bacterium]|nr:PAS domain S-box protein [Thermodesulfobacteriota bacterium]